MHPTYDRKFSNLELSVMYGIIIGISTIFLIIAIILLIIYIRRKAWNILMVVTTLLGFFCILHCIITGIPLFDSGVICDITSSLHETTELFMVTFIDYYVFYAYISLGKPNFVYKYKYIFHHGIIIAFIIMFIIFSVAFALWGIPQYDDYLKQCRLENEGVKIFLLVYIAILGLFALVLLVLLIVLVFSYIKKYPNDGYDFNTLKCKMIIYTCGLVFCYTAYIFFLIKEKYRTYGTILTSKIIECVTGLAELLIFSFNEKLIIEVKELFCCYQQERGETINSRNSNINHLSEEKGQEIPLLVP